MPFAPLIESSRLIEFLLKTVGISLSGVLAPGPMTAATLAAGIRSPHAGAMIAVGHAAIEGPLMLLILAGAGAVFEVPSVKLGIGLAGGAFLLFLGGQLLAALRKGEVAEGVAETRHPFVTGVVLTAANPYFLIWWATVGMALATDAVNFGVLAFVLFGALHWLCDLVWLEILSVASYKGTEVLGGKLQQAVLLVCGIMLVGFGVMFLRDAWLGLMGTA
ncbi:MAG: LysE family transporter [Planctomycetaceae bacterium]|nr:LysE family transporter [Planctomycetaceae bacterium]